MAKKNLEIETYYRKMNLLIYGIDDATLDDQLEKSIRSIFTDTLQIGKEKTDKMLFVNYHRLPSRKPPRPEANGKVPPVPVIVKFVRFTDREVVMRVTRKHSRDLAVKKLQILSDLPPSLKILRGKLASKAFKLRNGEKNTRLGWLKRDCLSRCTTGKTNNPHGKS